MSKSIKSEEKTLREIFKNNNIFKIPDFQRDFVWGKNEVNMLFDDFSEDTDDFTNITGEGYLLGNIVTIQTAEDKRLIKEVIDGQQRLTVLSLLFYALNHLIADIKKEIAAEYKHEEITNDEMLEKFQLWSSIGSELDMAYSVESGTTNSLKIQHDSSLLIGSHYKSFFKQDTAKDDHFDDSETTIDLVYNVIEGNVQQIANSINGKEKIKNFINYLKDHVYLIETSAISLSKAFQLFEVLNQRGVGLTPLDLIKNLLLKRLVDIKELGGETKETMIEERRVEFRDLWYSFASKLEFSDGRRNPINSSTFLKHYLIGKEAKKLTDKKLFEYFSTIKLKTSEVLVLIEEFIKVLSIYKELEMKNYDKFTNDSQYQLVMQLIFESFGNKQAHSLLIPFYEEDEALKIKVVNYAVRLVAAITYAEGSPSSLETIIAQANKKLYRNEDDELNLSEFFDYLQTEIEKNSERAKAIVEMNEYRNRLGKPNNKSKYLFKFLEIVAHNENPFSQTGSSKGKKVITLEHIMPQTLSEESYTNYGISSEVEHKDYLNRIGNLAIIEQPDNSAMKDKAYKEKKAFFANTVYYTTKSLAVEIKSLTKSGHKYKVMNTANNYLYERSLTERNYWDVDAIEKRSKIIAKYLHYVLNNAKV